MADDEAAEAMDAEGPVDTEAADTQAVDATAAEGASTSASGGSAGMGPSESHYAGRYPVRLPVWWARRGPAGPHPDLPGVTGRHIMLRHLKPMKRIERGLQRLLRAPKDLRRPLDAPGSLLWELCDGSRTFETIVELLDATLHERIAPAADRCQAAIDQWRHLRLVVTPEQPFDGRWATGPGLDASGKLGPLPERVEVDITPVEGDLMEPLADPAVSTENE